MAARRCRVKAALFQQPELAETLAWIAEEGDAPFYQGELARRLVGPLRPSRADTWCWPTWKTTRPIQRTPLQHRYRGYRVATNPAPSSGGTLINFALAALDDQDIASAGFGSAQHLKTLAEVMAYTNVARDDGMLARSGTPRMN